MRRSLGATTPPTGEREQNAKEKNKKSRIKNQIIKSLLISSTVKLKSKSVTIPNTSAPFNIFKSKSNRKNYNLINVSNSHNISFYFLHLYILTPPIYTALLVQYNIDFLPRSMWCKCSSK